MFEQFIPLQVACLADYADLIPGTLEAVVGFHVSHARNAAWVELPLLGVDRDREVLSA